MEGLQSEVEWGACSIGPPVTERLEELQRWVWLLAEGVGAFSRPFCLQPPTYRNAEHATERTDRNDRPKPDFTNSKVTCINIVTNIKTVYINNIKGKSGVRIKTGKNGVDGNEMSRLCLSVLKRKGEEMRKDGRAIAIWVDHDTADKVAMIAKKVGISNSQLLKNLVLCGLEDAEVLDKLGMLNLAMLVKKAKERINSMADEGKRQISEA